MSDSIADYDYVIVGAGAAGCLLAGRLAADPNVRVLLVEAGGGGDYVWSRAPAGWFRCIGDPEVDWCSSTEAIEGLAGRAVAFPRGKGLGGSTVLGGMVYLRGQPADFDAWAGLGNAGWSWTDVRPLFTAHEDQQAVAKRDWISTYGIGGQWHIEAGRHAWPVLGAWIDACKEAGIAPCNDLGGGAGAGYFGLSQRGGMRWDSAKAFISSATPRKNLSILTHAHVTRLLIDQGRVSGVVLRRNNLPLRIGVKREAILTAGAIGSPALLMMSGIGPGETLRGAGVEVMRELAGVGSNLQDHLDVPTVYAVSGTKTFNETTHSLVKRAMIMLQYNFLRSGELSSAPAPAGALAHSAPEKDRPDLLLKAHPFSLTESANAFGAAPGVTISVCGLRPESRGSVKITAPDVDRSVAISPSYLASTQDCLTAVGGLRLVRRIMQQAALAPFTPRLGDGYDVADTGEDLLALAQRSGVPAGDACGTCKMGQDETAVVDERLKVRGIGRLRIADASIMPTIVSAPTTAATLMIAEKAAQMIREDWRG